MRNVLYLCLLLAGIAFSCTTEHETSGVTAGEESNVFIQLISDLKAFDKSYGQCEDDSSTCTSVSLTYPQFSGTLNSAAEEKLNTRILSLLMDDILYDSTEFRRLEAFATAFIGEYKEVQSEFGEAFGWQYEGDVDVLRNDSSCLTLRFEKYVYTGGAHGMYAVWYYNFNPQTGEEYSMDDYFRQPFADSLNMRIKRAFLAEKGLTSASDLSDAGYWIEDDQYYNENIALLPDSVIFYYNQYEVAPYAMGPTRLALPIGDFEDLLRERFR